MTTHVTSFTKRSIRLGDINADGTSGHALDYLVQLEVLKAEYAQVAIVACCNYPVLSVTLPDTKCGNIIDLATIES